jgi:hypothetical protein
MKFHDVLAVVATLCFIAPVLVIFSLGLFVNKSLLALALYCVLAGLYHAMSSDLLTADKQIILNSVLVFSYADAPLILGLLTLYCHTPLKKKLVYTVAVSYILFEALVAIRFGWQVKSTFYTSGIGLVLIFGLGIYFFTAQLKQTIRFSKGMGRAFIAAAIFFSYGLYAIVYFVHCVFEAPGAKDTFVLHHTASIIFCVLVTTGLVHLYLRHRQVKQVLQVRRELQDFFAA